MRTDKTIINFFLVPLICLLILTGCQTIGNTAGSQKVLKEHLLLIPGQGTLNVTWESRVLTIAYKGRVNRNLLEMEGQIDITGGGIQHFSMLERLVVDIYFTDSSGSVLNRLKFYSTHQSPINDRIPRPFTRSYELPEGTTHIAFGYDGNAREGGSSVLRRSGDATEHGFQHSPYR